MDSKILLIERSVYNLTSMIASLDAKIVRTFFLWLVNAYERPKRKVIYISRKELLRNGSLKLHSMHSMSD